VRDPVRARAGLLQVVNVFVARNGAPAERAVRNGLQQGLIPAALYTGFDKVAHLDGVKIHQGAPMERRGAICYLAGTR
jgi:hypothetical protein